MTATREHLLETARRAALLAGEAILKVYATPFDVQQKTDKTPVTEADLASERIIVAMLTKAFPDIPIASEEAVEAEGLPPSSARFWVVDPLDGTKEFIARNGEFAVLIALVEDGSPVLGIVHGPAVGINGNRHVLPEVKDADIIQSEDVVGVLVGEDDGVQPSHPGAQGLLAKVGRGIDDDRPSVVL